MVMTPKHFRDESSHSGNVSLPIIAILLLFVVVLGISYASIHALSLNPTRFVVGLLAMAAACFDVACSIHTARHEHQMRSIVHLVAGSVLATVLLEFLTLVGDPASSPFDISSWRWKRMALFLISTYTIASFVSWYWGFGALRGRMHASFQSFLQRLSITLLAQCAAIIAAGGLIGCAFSFIGGHPGSICIAFGLLVGVAASVIWTTRKHIAEHPEYAVFAVIVCIGSVCIYALPATTNIANDDQIHYKNAVDTSYIVSHFDYEGEITVRNPAYVPDFDRPHDIEEFNNHAGLLVWNFQDSKDFNEALNKAVADSELVFDASTIFDRGAALFSYFPMAVGLWLGRLLHLPFTSIFALGKYGNLIFYALTCAFAVRIIPRKKMVVAIIALIPSNIFFAANYSYDPWMTSLVLLGLALIFRARESEGTQFRRLMIASCIALFFAITTKAVCFPLMLLVPILLHGTARRQGDKSYLLLAEVLILALVFTFILPLIASSGTAFNDSRGGSNVSATGQIAFMLQHPADAARIIFSFLADNLFTYIWINDSYVAFAYLGTSTTGFAMLERMTSIALVGVSITDSFDDPSKHTSPAEKMLTFLVYLVTALMVTLAMYLGFTPVGSETIAGVQPRYLLPLTVLILLPIFDVRVANLCSERKYNLSVISIAALFTAFCFCNGIVACIF